MMASAAPQTIPGHLQLRMTSSFRVRECGVSRCCSSAPSLAGCWRLCGILSRGFLREVLGYPVGRRGGSAMAEPRVIYEPKPGSPIDVDRPFYDRLAGETGRRTLVDRFVVPMRSGRAWPV